MLRNIIEMLWYDITKIFQNSYHYILTHLSPVSEINYEIYSQHRKYIAPLSILYQISENQSVERHNHRQTISRLKLIPFTWKNSRFGIGRLILTYCPPKRHSFTRR
jgi:hypothetical protein